MVINKHFDKSITAEIDITGFKPNSNGNAFVLTGTGIDANTGTALFKAPGMKWARQAQDKKNPRFEKGSPNEITLKKYPISTAGVTFEHSFSRHSVTAIVLEAN